ncbi:60S ribosomal export protein NMD3, partial [Trifolium pratense]
MCLRCLCSEVDITEELLRHLVLVHCSECESYLQPPRTWDKSLLTSRDLVEYIVLTLEVVSSKVGSSEVTMCGTEYVLADVQVARKANRNDAEYDKHKGHIPEVILIKKIDEEKWRYRKHSSWRSLSMEFDDEDEIGAYDDSILEKILNDFE